jgi:hypothetical protein
MDDRASCNKHDNGVKLDQVLEDISCPLMLSVRPYICHLRVVVPYASILGGWRGRDPQILKWVRVGEGKEWECEGKTPRFQNRLTPLNAEA